jgi:hypothetical protein
MALTAEQLQTKRDALISQIAQATESLRKGDKAITYQSIEQMRLALSVLDGEISRVTGAAVGRITRFYTKAI